MQEQRGASLTDARTIRPPRRRPSLVWGVAIAAVLADQGSKIWALRALDPGVRQPLLGDLVSLRLIRNPGAAFSMLDGATYAVTVIAVLIVVRMLYLAHTRALSPVMACLFGSVVGGAVGNLLDRLLREPGVGRGHVVDFIDYFGLFVGNIADVVIVVAAAVFGWLAVRGVRLDGTRAA
jgi:signal peptidase II